MKSKPQTLNDLKPNARNPRKISDERLEMLRKSLEEHGDLSGFVVNQRTGTIISGHQRQKVLPAKSKIVVTRNYPKPTRTGTVEEGWIVADGESFAYRKVDWPKANEQKALLAANQHGGEFDVDALEELLKDMPDADRLLAGFDLESLSELGIVLPDLDGALTPEQAKTTLADRFIVPPFSVLDARQGYWQERKKAWIALGIQSELGRGGGA